MREEANAVVVEWVKRIPLDEIASVIVLLSARLVAEKKPADVHRECNAPEQEKMLTAGELAKQLNVPESWIRSEQRAGRIPYKRFGKYVRFRRREIEVALADNTK
jgi:excisionase family DNA binding protein